MTQTLQIQYFARLREESRCSEEKIESSARNAKELYTELKKRYGFTLPESTLRVAVNDEFQNWDTPLQNQDRIAFIPPVAGG